MPSCIDVSVLTWISTQRVSIWDCMILYMPPDLILQIRQTAHLLLATHLAGASWTHELGSRMLSEAISEDYGFSCNVCKESMPCAVQPAVYAYRSPE